MNYTAISEDLNVARRSNHWLNRCHRTAHDRAVAAASGGRWAACCDRRLLAWTGFATLGADLCFGPFGGLVGDLLALAIAFLLAGCDRVHSANYPRR